VRCQKIGKNESSRAQSQSRVIHHSRPDPVANPVCPCGSSPTLAYISPTGSKVQKKPVLRLPAAPPCACHGKAPRTPPPTITTTTQPPFLPLHPELAASYSQTSHRRAPRCRVVCPGGKHGPGGALRRPWRRQSRGPS
jgi:hypothetical protein